MSSLRSPLSFFLFPRFARSPLSFFCPPLASLAHSLTRLPPRPPRITAHYANVADESSVDACIQQVLTAQAAAAEANSSGTGTGTGTSPSDITINGLVTSAGFTENLPAVDYPPARLRALWAVNVDGTYLFATAVARHLQAKRVSSTVSNTPPASMVLVGSMSGAVVNVPQPQA